MNSERPDLPRDEEFARLKRLLDAAYKSVREADDDYARTQLDSSKERTQYFEKLAIGSGAAIAAIVSFLGVHADLLKPHWTLQSALVLLVIVMVACLYRNFRYPYYVMAVKALNCARAQFHKQQRMKEILPVSPRPFSWSTGESIDSDEWIARANEADDRLKPAIDKLDNRQKRQLKEVRVAENICLASLALAMISLVWLALKSF